MVVTVVVRPQESQPADGLLQQFTWHVRDLRNVVHLTRPLLHRYVAKLTRSCATDQLLVMGRTILLGLLSFLAISYCAVMACSLCYPPVHVGLNTVGDRLVFAVVILTRISQLLKLVEVLQCRHILCE